MGSDAARRRRVLAFVLLLAAPAAAQPDEQTKAAARQLAQDGALAFEQGRDAEAQDLLHRAYELVPAPTIALLEGRALERLGRWVEAAEHYELARRTALDPDASEAFRRAVADAERELRALRRRIPYLTIEIRGVDRHHPDLAVELDGRPVVRELLGVRRPIDPGEHQIVARTPTETVSRSVKLAEKQQQRVVLSLEPPPVAAAPPARAVDSGQPGSAQQTWGFIGLGVGAAGLATGVVSGLIMLDKQSNLDEVCKPSCPREAEGDVDSFRTARTISLVGYIVGAVGIGAGSVLLLTAPSSEGPSMALAPVVSSDGAGIGVSGGFF